MDSICVRSVGFTFMLAAMAGCTSAQMHVAVDVPETSGRSWHEEFAGRKLQVVTTRYALYARDPKVAQELRDWVDIELEALASRGLSPQGPGLVAAIEDAGEGTASVEAWRAQNVSRRRSISWQSPIRNQSYQSADGRPYSFFHRAYFTESFSMPPRQAAELGLLDVETLCPTWICFLTTGGHVASSFRDEADRQDRAMRAAPRTATSDAHFGDLVFGLALALVKPFMVAEYQRIDVQLMQLQRREALGEAVIATAGVDETMRACALRRLHDVVEAQWKDLFFRPLE